MRAIFRKEFPNDFLMRIRMRHFPKIVSAWDIRMSQVSEWEARMGFAQSSRGGFLKPDNARLKKRVPNTGGRRS
jgi:hypothetical protein